MVSQRLKLKNGTRALFAPLKETKAVTALILFPIGSRYETKPLNGASHFIEHLFFKGTKSRPTTLEISKELDGVGAEYNAFTAKDHTGYYVKVSADKLDLALDVLSDMLYRSIFDPKEIERERGVVIEEINMYEDNPMMHIEDLFEQLIFRGNSLGRSIAGPRSVIRSITRRQLMAYKAQHYTPSNALVCIAGRFDRRRATALVQRYFSGQRGSRRRMRAEPYRAVQRRPRVSVLFRDTEQSQLAFGFPSFGYGDPRMPALSILAIALGGNMSSRLFVNIRERLGLCYFIRTENSVYQGTGCFVVRAGLQNARINEAIERIWKELTAVVENGITPEELRRSQEFVKGKIILALEDSEHIADWVGKQLLLEGKIETPEQKIAKLFRVTRSDVQAVAADILRLRTSNLVLIGPFRTERPFTRLIENLS